MLNLSTPPSLDPLCPLIFNLLPVFHQDPEPGKVFWSHLTSTVPNSVWWMMPYFFKNCNVTIFLLKSVSWSRLFVQGTYSICLSVLDSRWGNTLSCTVPCCLGCCLCPRWHLGHVHDTFYILSSVNCEAISCWNVSWDVLYCSCDSPQPWSVPYCCTPSPAATSRRKSCMWLVQQDMRLMQFAC